MIMYITPMYIIQYLLMVVTGTAKGGFTMSTISTQIKNITVDVYEGSVSYSVTFKDSFDGIRKSNDGIYADAQIDTITFTRKQLIKLLIDVIPNLNSVYSFFKEQAALKEETNKFGAAHIIALLDGATIDLVRTRFEAGDEYMDDKGVMRQHTNAGYNTAFGKVELSDAGQKFFIMLYNAILGI